MRLSKLDLDLSIIVSSKTNNIIDRDIYHSIAKDTKCNIEDDTEGVVRQFLFDIPTFNFFVGPVRASTTYAITKAFRGVGSD